MMRTPGSHITAALLRAVAAQAGLVALDREKPIMIVEEAVSTDWASATFVGATHKLSLRFEGAEAAMAAAFGAFEGLAERDIAIPGHIVAELATTPGPTQSMTDNLIAKTLTVNVLTIMD
jgi:hypothetical protein